MKTILFLFILSLPSHGVGIIDNICSTPAMDVVEKSVGKIVVPGVSHASGFSPTPNLFLTAFHAIDEIPEGENPLAFGQLIRVSKVYDLALFALDGEGEDYLEIDPSPVVAGEALCGMGFVGHSFERVSKTYPTAYINEYKYEFSTNKSSDFAGISGGPIVNVDKKVRGIIIRVETGKNTIVSTTAKAMADFVAGSVGLDCTGFSLQECVAKEMENFLQDSDPYARYLQSLHYAKVGNMDLAMKAIRASANEGYHQAQYILGETLIESAVITGPDTEEGIKRFKQLGQQFIYQAAEKYYLALAYLCRTYSLPHPNYQERGLRCLRELANNYGPVEIQFLLGEVYLKGLYGVTPQMDLAVKYLTLASGQGYGPAQALLREIE